MGDGWPDVVVIERGTSVIDNAERKPVLFDAKNRPLLRQVGFQPKEKSDEGQNGR